MRSIANLELMTNPIGTLALESALFPGFLCLRHPGSLNLGHPTAVCLPRQRGLILTNKLVSFRAQAPKDRRRNNWRIVAEASRLSPGAGRPSYDSYSFADPKATNTV